MKLWVPLENNPEVMSRLAHKLGLSTDYKFYDIFSLTEPDLIALSPRPCHALLFTMPTTAGAEKFYEEEEAKLPFFEGNGPDEPVLFYHQTIGHACGLIGMLHCTTNLSVSGDILKAGSTLKHIRDSAIPLGIVDRSQLLYDSEALEAAHKEAAQQGDSIAPRAEDYEDGHAFIAFVKDKNGYLWELEGRHKGPVKRGHLAEHEDLLSEKALMLGPRSYLRREQESGNGEFRFSCTALCPSHD